MKKTILIRTVSVFMMLMSLCGNLFSAIDISNMYIDGRTDICEGENIDITLHDYVSNNPLQFQFSVNGTVIQDFSLNNNFNYLPTDTGEMLIEIVIREDVTDEEESVETIVNVIDKPVFAPAVASFTVCFPNTVDITQPEESGFFFTYYESDLTTIVSNPASINTGGTFFITKTNETYNCVSDTIEVAVTINEKPVIMIVSPTITECYSADITQPEIPTPSIYTYHYSYYNSDFEIVSDPTNVTESGTYYVSRTNDQTGCVSDTLSIVVTIMKPVFTPTSTAFTACFPNTVDITQPAETGFSFTYYESDLTTIVSNPSNIDAGGTFFITKTNETYNCVSDTIEITVSVNEKPEFSLEPTITSCTSANITQPYETGFTFTYFETDGITILANPSGITTNGTFFISKTNNETGCVSDTLPITVIIDSNPSFTPAFTEITACFSASIVQPEEVGFSFEYFESDRVTVLANPAAILVSGTYYVSKVENVSGCTSDTAAIEVTIDPKPVFNPIAPTPVCSPNTVSIEQAPEVGFEFSYYQNAAATIPLLNYTEISASGTFYIVKRDEETGCESNTMPIVVTVHITPVANAGADRTVCEREITRLGGTSQTGVTYSWSPAINFVGSATVANPTVIADREVPFYVLTVRSNASGCFSTDTVFIRALKVPEIFSISGGGYHCTGDLPTATFVELSDSETDVFYSLYNGTTLINQRIGTGAPLRWENLQSGNYTVRARQLEGCEVNMIGLVTIEEIVKPTATITASRAVLCPGDSADITIRLSGTPPFILTYESFSGLQTTVTTSDLTHTFRVHPLVTSTWRVISLEDFFCETTYQIALRPSVIITVGADIDPTITTLLVSGDTICSGYPITLTPVMLNPSLFYRWSTGETTQTITVRPTTTATYSLEIRDNLGCAKTGIITINVRPLPEIDFIGPDVSAGICINSDPIPLIGIPPGGVFSGPNVIGSTYYPTSAPGTDFITYTFVDIHGCRSEITKHYNINSLPRVDWYVPEEPGPPMDYQESYEFCRFFNDSIPLQGIPRSNSNTTWTLDKDSGSPATLVRGNDGSAYIRDALPGIYHVTYRFVDNNGCEASKTKTITISSDFPDSLSLGVIIMPDTLCNRETNVLIKASQMDGVFTVNDPRMIISQNSSTGELWINPSLVGVGRYRVMYHINDAQGCSNNHSIFKDFNIQAPVNINPLRIPNRYCVTDAPVTFELTSPSPVSGFVYIIKNNVDTVLNQTPNTATLIFNPAWGVGNYEIIYHYSDRICPNTYRFNITVFDTPIINMNLVRRDYCYGDIVTLNATPAGGYYTSSNGNVGLTLNRFNTRTSGTGTFMIYYHYVDTRSCPAVDSVEIYVRGQEDGNMQILNLEEKYCESKGTVIISGFPTENGVPYFRETVFLTDLGDGTALIDLTQTNFNSVNNVTFYFKEYYTNFYGQRDSCIHSVTRSFRILSEGVDFFGFNDGDTICAHLDSVLLIGTNPVNSWFEINTPVTGTEINNLPNGRAALYPNQLTEAWYTITFYAEIYDNNTLFCTVEKSKSFYLLPTVPYEPRVICSGNRNAFTIDNSESGVIYELWVNGRLYDTQTGNDGNIFFAPLPNQDAICVFYATKNMCRTQHPKQFNLAPLTINISRTANISCFGNNDGQLTAVVNGGLTPVAVSWSSSSATNFSTDLIVSNLGPETYTIIATDSIGCTATASMTLQEPLLLELNIVSQSGILCNGSNEGFAQVIATGGTTPYTYQWLDENSNVISNTGSISRVTAGTYRVSVRDRNNCSANIVVLIQEYTAIAIDVTRVQHVEIFGQATGEIDINVTGGLAPYTYEWVGLGINPANRNDQNQTGLIAGRYFLTVTDANGCKKDIFVDITQEELLLVTATTRNISCFGANDGFIDLTVSGGVTPYTFLWTKGGIFYADTEDLINLAPGIYSVVVTDDSGDTFTQNYQITSPDSLIILTKGNTNLSILCYGETTGVLDVEARGGTPAYSYEWSGSVPAGDRYNPYVTNLPAGTYRMRVTDAHNCVTVEDFVIVQPNELEITGSVTIPPTCFNSRDASISITVSGGVLPYDYFWEGSNVIPSNQNQSNIGFGTYRVTVTDANNCQVSQEFILANPEELRISISSVSDICIGADVELQFSMNANRNWTIVYTDGTNNYTINPVIANAFVNHTITQNTTFTILHAFDQNGCMAMIENRSTLVTVHNYPDITLLQTNFAICAGEEIFIPFSLSGQGPWSVVFTDGDRIYGKSNIPLGIDSLHLLPDNSKTYRLVSVSTDYCTTNKSDEVTVVVHPMSQLSASCAVTSICGGDPTTIELTLQGDAPWRVFYTEGTEEKNVLVPYSPFPLVVNPQGTTRYGFHTVESAFGCRNAVTADIIISSLPLPGTIIGITGPSEVCAGEQAVYFVPAVVNVTEYVWSIPSGVTILNGANTNQIRVQFSTTAQSGTFSVYAKNACGNSETVELPVTVVGLPGNAGTITLPAALCQGEQNFFISIGIIPNATEYVWTLPYGFDITQGAGTRDIRVSLRENAIPGIISVFGKNVCGQGASSQTTVTISTFPTIEAGPDAFTDCSDQINLNALSAAPYQGTWRVIQGRGTFQSIYDPRTLVTGIAQGENLYVWEVWNGVCTRSDTVKITNRSPDKAVPEITGNFILCEESLTLRANNPTNGVGRWDVVRGSATIEDPNSNVTTATDFGYGHNQLRWTISNGTCSNSALVDIYYYSARNHIFPEITDTTFVTQYRLAAASVLEGMTGEWERIAGDGTIDEPTNPSSWVRNLSPGLNTFRWTVGNEYCSSYSEVKVYYLADPIALFRIDTLEGCSPFTPFITNTSIGVAKFLWDFGDGTTSTAFNPIHTYEEPGIYTIKLTAIGQGRTTESYQEINVRRGPRIEVNVLSSILYIPNANLMVLNGTTGATRFLWDFGTGSTSTERNPVYTYREPGIYDIKLVAIGQHNCADSITLRNAVVVKSRGFITFPNAFVPNKGYANGGEFSLITRNHDVFYPIWDDVDESSYILEIFNRWGEKIFVSKDINTGWDGYVDGKLSPTGVYIYKSTGRFNSGDSFSKRGEVTLIQ